MDRTVEHGWEKDVWKPWSEWIRARRYGLNYKGLAGAAASQYSRWITGVRRGCAGCAPAHRNVRKTSLLFCV